MELMGMIAAERRQLADLVDTLDPDQLDMPSLCGAWTVKEVVAHLVSPFAARPSSLVPLMLGSGFNLHGANAQLARMIARQPVEELTAVLRKNAENQFRPPVVGHFGQLTDLQVHGQDIRRPLGLPHELRPERLRVSLDFLVGPRSVAFGRKRQRAGLRFLATDQDWAWGSGPMVRGTAEALLLALTGRAVVLAELDGDGVPVLRRRLT